MLQHMPHTASTIHKSTEMLGAVVDDILANNSVSSRKLSTVDIESLDDINLYLRALSDSYKNTSISLITAIAASTPAGYGVAKMIDTNSNPSNWKTMGTLFAGGIATGAVERLVNAFAGIDIGEYYYDNFNEINRKETGVALTQALKDNAAKGVNYLVARGLVDAEKAPALIKALEDAQNANKRIAGIAGAIYGIESLFTAYHGYKRNNDSIGYGLAWWLTSGVGLGVALGQGYAKPLNK